MSSESKTVRQEIAKVFHKVLRGELAAEELEKWMYDCKPLEEDLTAEDHLALLSLDYRRSDALHEARKLILNYVDLAAFETENLRRVLGDIKERTEHAFTAVQATYDLYSHGYEFLDNLGLGYGLSLVDYSPRLAPKAKDELLDDCYPEILLEVDKVLEWLDAGKVVLTGGESDDGRMRFEDHRPAEDKKPTAYTRVETPRPMRELSAWDRIKKAWGLATFPEKAVKKAFLATHPHERVSWTNLKADEPDRFVVGVFYGSTRPPRYAFFALSKEDASIVRIEDDSPYRPEVWR